jgi:hypothetical protein
MAHRPAGTFYRVPAGRSPRVACSVAQGRREQDRELDAKSGSHAFHIVDRDIAFASLDGGNERAVEPRELGQFLLGDTELHSCSPDVRGERNAGRGFWSFHSLLHRLLRCLWCHTPWMLPHAYPMRLHTIRCMVIRLSRAIGFVV